MLSRTKSQKRQEGQVVEIALSENRKSFARVLHEPLLAFYDKQYDSLADPTIDEITAFPIAFKICVMNSAITKSRWKVVGTLPLTPDMRVQPMFCKQDIISKKLSIYHEIPELAPSYERHASIEECIGLETAAVWAPEHVEDRLRDHFLGRPNKWVENLTPKLVHRREW
jgi:hypothetical protein